MKSPFPGMDPYLETRWRDVHSSLATYSRDALNRVLPQGLIARAEERSIVATDDEPLREIGPDVSVIELHPDVPRWETGSSSIAVADAVCVKLPDREFRQHFLEIRDVRSGGRVITVIEFVSPTNKRPGDGLNKYRQKQLECREGDVNLVEIDLTRAGDRSLVMPIDLLRQHDRTTYQSWVTKATETDRSWAYRLPLTQRLAAIPIPLRPTDKEVLLDLQPLIDQVYENGRYSEEIDYTDLLDPPLSNTDAAWVAELLAARVQASTPISPVAPRQSD